MITFECWLSLFALVIKKRHGRTQSIDEGVTRKSRRNMKYVTSSRQLSVDRSARDTSLVTHHFHEHTRVCNIELHMFFSCFVVRTAWGNRHHHQFLSLSPKSCVNWRNSFSARFSKVNDHFDNFSFYCWKLSNYCSVVSSITYIDWTNRLFFSHSLRFCRLSLASHK